LAVRAAELAGIAGPAGATGAPGPQGVPGPVGARGLIAPGNGWSVYRDYSFGRDGNGIGRLDVNKAQEIAAYVDRNPSYRIGIDGAHQARVGNVRNALIDAGVPADRIETGAFGDPQVRGDNRVAVLIRN